MNWFSRYHDRKDFMASFDSEQEYVDAMFIYIIMSNFGVWINTQDLSTFKQSKEGRL